MQNLFQLKFTVNWLLLKFKSILAYSIEEWQPSLIGGRLFEKFCKGDHQNLRFIWEKFVLYIFQQKIRDKKYSFCMAIKLKLNLSKKGPSWSWLYCSWIYNYMYPSPLNLWVRTSFIARCTRYNIMW